MKKQIIEQIRNKKNRNGVEQFLYMCEIAPKLNPRLDKTRAEILGHFVDIERHKQAQRDARAKAQKSYTDFALTPDFPMLLSHLVLSINTRPNTTPAPATPTTTTATPTTTTATPTTTTATPITTTARPAPAAPTTTTARPAPAAPTTTTARPAPTTYNR